MPAGQPAKYKTPKEMQKKFDEYFEHCRDEGLIPNVVGMSLYLGFAGRVSLKHYEDRDEKFFNTIKAAKDRAYDAKFQAAASGKMNTTIFIFDSVNNHGMINTRSEGKNELTGKGGGAIETKWTVETISSGDKD